MDDEYLKLDFDEDFNMLTNEELIENLDMDSGLRIHAYSSIQSINIPYGEKK